MKHYNLGLDEVELYKAFCQLEDGQDLDSLSEMVEVEDVAVEEGKDTEKSQETNGQKRSSLFGLLKRGEDGKKPDKKAELAEKYNDEVVLTNYNLILVNRTKKRLLPEHVETDTYPLSEIKIYNGKPHFVQKDKSVEIFFINGERTLYFSSKPEMRKLVDKVISLITGKNSFTRATDKVKGAVGVVDDALGIDSVGMAKSLATSVLPSGITDKIKANKLPESAVTKDNKIEN